MRNYNLYDVWTRVIQSFIKLHTAMFRILKNQGKFKHNYTNKNACS